MRLGTSLVVAVSVLAPVSAWASGFELREASAHAMGTSYAGAAASDSDASFLFFNPASLGGVRDMDLSADAAGLFLGSSGTFGGTTAVGTPTGGETNPSGFISNAFVPAVAARYRLGDDWAIGLSVASPWGESTKYPALWTGRYYAMTTRLTSINIEPLISYDVFPGFTVAAGPQIQYLNAELTEGLDFGTLGTLAAFPGAMPGQNDGIVRLHGNSWAAGYVLGALWKPLPSFSFGVSYRSGIDQTLSGSEEFTYDSLGIASTLHSLTGAFANSSGKTTLPTPAAVMGGARWAIDNRWTALAGVEYTNWSSLKQLLVVSDNPANPESLTLLDWKNTWFGSLGVEYRADERLTLRLGTAYDEAAAPGATVEPRIPDADRYWLSGGVGYRWSQMIDLNLAVSHLFTPHSTIALSALQPGNALRGSLAGVSNSDATLVSAQVVLHDQLGL